MRSTTLFVLALATLALAGQIVADEPTGVTDVEAVDSQAPEPVVVLEDIAPVTHAPEMSVPGTPGPAWLAFGCVEPSPCITHADCSFPQGVCLPNLDYPQVPSAKVCHCLPDF